MDEYTPNSRKFKEEQKEKKTDSVVTGSVRLKKKSEFGKLRDIFISEDVSNVKSYILMDVLVPAIKKAVDDIVTNGIHMILYGGRGQTKSTSPASKVSYRSFYDSNPRPVSSYNTPIPRDVFDYENIIFETRGDAEAVLDAMNDIISQFRKVSVADLFDLANAPTANYTAYKYGWTDIFGCKPIRIGEGYILKLPRPIPID